MNSTFKRMTFTSKRSEELINSVPELKRTERSHRDGQRIGTVVGTQMTKMTSVLNKAIIEGHNEEMFNHLLAKIIDSNEYEQFIHSSIFKALIKVFLPNKSDGSSHSSSEQIYESSPQDLRQGIRDLVNVTLEENNI